MALEILEVARAVVHSHSNGHSEQVFPESTGAPRGCGELHTGVVFSLQLVLVFGQECQVTDIVQDDGVMHAAFEASHTLGEDLQGAHLEFQSVLEE